MAKTTKNAKNENAATVAREAFAAAAAKHGERVEMLAQLDVTAFDADQLAEHKADVLAARNRAERSQAWAALLGNEAFAEAFVQFALTQEKVAALQIYAQDKLAATLRAIAANCALSAIRAGNHSNNMTQRLVHVLQTLGAVTVADAPRKMHDAFPDKSMGTYSAQASSSRQVLTVLGMLEFDALTKAFKLNDTGTAYLHVISK